MMKNLNMVSIRIVSMVSWMSMVPFESSFESSAAVAGSIRLPHPIFQRCSEISSDSKTQDTGRGLYILYIRIYRTYVFLKSPFGYRVSRQVIFTFTTEMEGACRTWPMYCGQ